MGDASYFSYLCVMFVCKKKYRSDHIGVIVVDKSNGKFHEIKNFGVAKTDAPDFDYAKWVTHSRSQEMDWQCR